MDVISTILEKLKLSSAIYFKSDFAAPWGMDILSGAFAQFHMLAEGQCTLATSKQKIKLKAGDIIIFPQGTAHWIADKIKSKRRDGQEVVAEILNGNSVFTGTKLATTLVCGHFEFDRNFDHPFIHELPEIIHITEDEINELPWLRTVTDLIIKETQSKKAGSDILQKKLGEILFIHSIRAYMHQQQLKQGFLAAIQDRKIGTALKAIHQHPDQDWQLSSLARIAGMSRTGFSNQFKALLGETPLTYITNWRIAEAKGLLEESKKSVGEIAESVGYRSEAAFNRVFKKRVALTPLKYRKSVASG